MREKIAGVQGSRSISKSSILLPTPPQSWARSGGAPFTAETQLFLCKNGALERKAIWGGGAILISICPLLTHIRFHVPTKRTHAHTQLYIYQSLRHTLPCIHTAALPPSLSPSLSPLLVSGVQEIVLISQKSITVRLA